MSERFPQIVLARHGETAWSRSGQHTGRTDLPLTPQGISDAARLGERLKAWSFVKVYSSPLERAAHSCRLAGFPEAEIDLDLMEWDYGQFEGLKSAEIRSQQPGWVVFRDGAPGGETVHDVQERIARVMQRVRAVRGDVLLFSSGHFLRALAACWIGHGVRGGARLALGTASISVLGYDHNLDEPVIRLWNDQGHLGI